jgi:hypothetical protein
MQPAAGTEAAAWYSAVSAELGQGAKKELDPAMDVLWVRPTHVAVLQVGMGGMECYEKDFEEHLLSETGAYYRRKAAEWINQDSCPDYMRKVRAIGAPDATHASGASLLRQPPECTSRLAPCMLVGPPPAARTWCRPKGCSAQKKSGWTATCTHPPSPSF